MTEPVRMLVDSASFLRAYPEPGGWRVEHHARRWGGQAWAWRPIVARARTLTLATRLLFAEVGDYGRDVDAIARELERRAGSDPEPEL